MRISKFYRFTQQQTQAGSKRAQNKNEVSDDTMVTFEGFFFFFGEINNEICLALTLARLSETGA